MSFGFQVTNSFNQLIVSSDVKTLHFIGKASYVEIVRSAPEADESALGMGLGYVIYRFQMQCNAIPVPFFSQPIWQFHSIIGVAQISPGLWQFDIAVDGPSSSRVVPEVYVFSEASGAVTPPSEGFGMQVLTDTGEVAFDSRLPPFVVATGRFVKPPAKPAFISGGTLGTYIVVSGDYQNTVMGVPAGTILYMAPYAAGCVLPDINGKAEYVCRSANICGHGPDIPTIEAKFQDQRWSFSCDQSTEFPITLPQSGIEKPIFCYYGLSQYVREVVDHGAHNTSGGSTYNAWAWYWNAYRSAIQWTGDGIAAGWVAISKGYRYYYTKDTDGGWFHSDDHSSGAGGTWPAANTMINNNPQFVMVADGALYD